MMGGGGGHHQTFGDSNMAQDRGASPWSDQSNSALAHDAGIDDIGTKHGQADDSRHAGLFDQASNDGDYQDDTDMDADDFGGDGDGSDYA